MEENGTKISNEDVELDEDLKKEAAKGGEAEAESSSFFSSLVTNPFTLLLSLFLLPALWCVFVGIGWSKEDKVEDSVYEIWTRQRSELRRDEDYAEDLGRGDFGSSSFLAMAIARDGGNLMTSDRLETIRARMQETEEITIEHNGITYAWEDFCYSNSIGLGTTYKFPCFRVSPLDFFQEANWFFDESMRASWYNDLVQPLVVAPRIPRFASLLESCVQTNSATPPGLEASCFGVFAYRSATDNVLALANDIGNLENNHPCKQCIDTAFENTIDGLTELAQTVFGALAQLFAAIGELEQAQFHASIMSSISKKGVADFYHYYTVRQLYAQLGAGGYIEGRAQLNAITCPLGLCLDDITVEQAQQDLLNHADHSFSSSNTVGSPFPFWTEDGDGPLGLPLGQYSPTGGSGIDMSTPLDSVIPFLVTLQAGGMPTTEDIATNVFTNPIYVWFVAGVTNMTAHCGNELLKGSASGSASLDAQSALIAGSLTSMDCTKYNTPFEEDGTFTVQHFARMWFDLVVDSDPFLGLTQGESDPYTWTTGSGCGYNLKGARFSYTNSTPEELLEVASGTLYYIDEGESAGPIDTSLLLGGTESSVTVMQSLYPALLPGAIVDRVKNCNRPGGPITITESEAEEALFEFKKKFEEVWTQNWDDELSGDVQFVGYFDDSGASGTTGRMLEEITLSNGKLVVISIIILCAFSVLFVLDVDLVQSRTLLTLLGVGLVILAYFGAVGFGLIIGIKINITIAWTLPFILLGLGVDDMYIVLMALRQQEGYGLKDFASAMKETIIPITMTSVVNASMFAIMNINDIPAVFLTAQVGLISIVFLYLTVALCFSAWSYVDMRRQAAGRYDVCVCAKKENNSEGKSKYWADTLFYEKFFKPLFFSSSPIVAQLVRVVIFLIGLALLGLGIWGNTEGQRDVGLGLEDFFPTSNQASIWATLRTEELASWPVSMNWGNVDYFDPKVQMKVIKQFENVVSSPNIANSDTGGLWLASFNIWTTHQCSENFSREDPAVLQCGPDIVFPGDNSTCSGVWQPNDLGLKEKVYYVHPSEEDANYDPNAVCPRGVYDEGICRSTAEMHPLDEVDEMGRNASSVTSWCPVFKEWSAEKLGFCIQQWRNITGGGGTLVLEDETGTPTDCGGEYYNDEEVRVPIPFAKGPTLFAFDLFSHQKTLDMIEETRAICDDDEEVHCWMSGIPFQYWSQYIGIYSSFWEIGGFSIAVGFVISFAFLLTKLSTERAHASGKIFLGSLCGALLISMTTFVSLLTVSGLSTLFSVSFTGFSMMSFVLSVAFAVEYSVHIVARWLRAPMSVHDRVEYTMSFLFLPNFMSFVSSTIGVACLAFTEFEFNEVFFFRPLIIVMFTTYFFGCWWLPVLLTLLDFDAVKMGT